MIEYVGHFAKRLSEWKKAREWPSPLLTNALEQIDAAIWLIGGDRYAQALASLHNSIELLFKAELERIHPLLIADRIHYPILKRLLKDEFHRHGHVQAVETEEFDFDKTIVFSEAAGRIKDLYPKIKDWKKELDELQRVRNEIIHRGSDKDKEDHYVHVISVMALPFLEMCLQLLTPIDIGKLIGPQLYREFAVARRVCEEVKRRGRTQCRHALKTVTTAVLYRDVDFPDATDDKGWAIDDSEREYHSGESLRKYVTAEWKCDPISVTCKICSSLFAFADIDEFDDSNPVAVPPQSLACAKCGLWIDREDFALAAIHYGDIPASEILGS
jgi:hypothetical protein